jgi:flap endonuclease-1
LVKLDLAFGTASEDMDALTFGTKFLLRGFNSKKEPICQIELAQVLEGFEMNMTEFVDLCILCGCDYTHSIGGMGPVTAYKHMLEEKNIEGVLKKVHKMNEDPTRKKKYVIPDKF